MYIFLKKQFKYENVLIWLKVAVKGGLMNVNFDKILFWTACIMNNKVCIMNFPVECDY